MENNLITEAWLLERGFEPHGYRFVKKNERMTIQLTERTNHCGYIYEEFATDIHYRNRVPSYSVVGLNYQRELVNISKGSGVEI